MSDDPFAVKDLEDFKQQAKKFIDRCKDPAITEEQLSGAKSAFTYNYLHRANMSSTDDYQATIVFQLAMKEYLYRFLQVTVKPR